MRQRLSILLPLLIGAVVAGLLWLGFRDADPLVLQLPLVALPIIVGAAFSAFAAVGAVLAARAQQAQTMALQAQDAQLSQDRRRFVQRLDHEFKNPLTALRASITNLKSASSADGQATAINTLTSQTARLIRLTTDLRKIAELETRELESAEVDLTMLLSEVDELIREKAGNTRQIILSIPRAPWPLPIIVGDWDLLFLAFYNLADNALKFSRMNDTLEIRAREEADHVIVEVADTGLGIPENELPHVWEDLYRGENGRAVAGSGLGLPLVKAIIERHSGTITLASRQGQGTNITVQLPKPSQT